MVFCWEGIKKCLKLLTQCKFLKQHDPCWKKYLRCLNRTLSPSSIKNTPGIRFTLMKRVQWYLSFSHLSRKIQYLSRFVHGYVSKVIKLSYTSSIISSYLEQNTPKIKKEMLSKHWLFSSVERKHPVFYLEPALFCCHFQEKITRCHLPRKIGRSPISFGW